MPSVKERLSILHGNIRHRLEMTALACHIFSIPLSLSFFMLCCSFPFFWPLVILYLIHIFLDSSPENGKLAPYALTFRSSKCWKYFADYFPIRLHRTVHLEPSFVPLKSKSGISQTTGPPLIWRLTFWWYYHLLKPKDLPKMAATGKKYIFGYHPHGIIGMGAIGGLATDGAGWSKLFPGIPVRLLTISNQFLLPIYREYLISLGMASVGRNSVENLLRKNQPICIVLGGAQESLLAKPGRMDLILKKRHGFIKLAMKVGNVDLVPLIAFGENEIYNQVENDSTSFLYQLQTKLKNWLGFTLPLMHARGVFNYDMGIVPYRRPIDIVVGRPVSIPKIESPTKFQVEYYQSLYIQELQRVFDDNKEKYYKDWSRSGKGADSFKLNILE